MRGSWRFYASWPQYVDHLAPIWHALDPEQRGPFHYGSARARAQLEAHGIDGRPRPRPGTERVVVAAHTDAKRYRHVALVEHGAGQAYDTPDPSYSGGSGRDMVALFLCPNEVVAERNRAAYPGAAVEVVGSPRIDALKAAAAEGGGSAVPNPPVALSFHWPCPLTPESGWAFDHFKPALPGLVDCFDCIGHGHPRFAGFFAQQWKDLRIPNVARFDEVHRYAWLYVCDNSSTLYEWAALDRPVVVLNSPTYRRDVDLWPRFWRCADVGVNCSDPDELVSAVRCALSDPEVVAARRREVVAEVFPRQDGRAAERSVDALLNCA